MKDRKILSISDVSGNRLEVYHSNITTYISLVHSGPKPAGLKRFWEALRRGPPKFFLTRDSVGILATVIQGQSPPLQWKGKV